jgi:hypothetical protein
MAAETIMPKREPVLNDIDYPNHDTHEMKIVVATQALTASYAACSPYPRYVFYMSYLLSIIESIQPAMRQALDTRDLKHLRRRSNDKYRITASSLHYYFLVVSSVSKLDDNHQQTNSKVTL